MLNGSVKNSCGAFMSGVDGGQSQNRPPLELMHLAAAGNTVVGDKYGHFLMFFFLHFFLVRVVGGQGGEGGGVKVRAVPMPR